jgi:hypothetical protein
MESLLEQIVQTGSEVAIIDITGVPTVDTLVAQHLMKTVAAARLMGVECIISGIRSARSSPRAAACSTCPRWKPARPWSTRSTSGCPTCSAPCAGCCGHRSQQRRARPRPGARPRHRRAARWLHRGQQRWAGQGRRVRRTASCAEQHRAEVVVGQAGGSVGKASARAHHRGHARRRRQLAGGARSGRTCGSRGLRWSERLGVGARLPSRRSLVRHRFTRDEWFRGRARYAQ